MSTEVKIRVLRIQCEEHEVTVRIMDEHFNVETIENVLRPVAKRLVKLVKPEGEKRE